MAPLLRILLLAAFVVAGSGGASAEDRGTAAEAQALVAKAVQLYKDKGAKAAFAAFGKRNGGFRDRDLYIFVIGPDHKVVAQGVDAGRVGLDAMKLKDSEGKLYGQAMIDAATAEGAWVDYVKLNPQTGIEEPKSSWVVKVDDYVFGSGIYKPRPEHGTPDEAKAMVEKAVKLFRAKGPRNAVAAIKKPGSGFRDRDLYLFVVDPDRLTVVHPDETMIGTDLRNLKDADGKQFGRTMVKTATPTGVWVDYRWRNPTSGAVENKSSWVVTIDDYILGCGVYRP
ncbi:MAG: cache domain-containing protein [Dongiaceae bacterium]